LRYRLFLVIGVFECSAGFLKLSQSILEFGSVDFGALIHAGVLGLQRRRESTKVWRGGDVQQRMLY